jgi:hypothetical protein
MDLWSKNDFCSEKKLFGAVKNLISYHNIQKIVGAVVFLYHSLNFFIVPEDHSNVPTKTKRTAKNKNARNVCLYELRTLRGQILNI